MRQRFFALWMLTLGPTMFGCSEAGDPICDRIYRECRGALLDNNGAAISRERCVRQLDALATKQPEQFDQLERCVLDAGCDAIADCFAP